MESLNRKIRVKVLYSNMVMRDVAKSAESSFTYSPASDKLHLKLESSTFIAH